MVCWVSCWTRGCLCGVLDVMVDQRVPLWCVGVMVDQRVPLWCVGCHGGPEGVSVVCWVSWWTRGCLCGVLGVMVDQRVPLWCVGVMVDQRVPLWCVGCHGGSDGAKML